MTTKKEIHKAGYDRGFSIASWNDLPEIGTEIPAFTLDNFIGLIENIDNAEEAFLEICCGAESNSRQFSPFEFECQELNDLDKKKPYDVWEVYEDGIQKGFFANWKSRKDYYEEK